VEVVGELNSIWPVRGRAVAVGIQSGTRLDSTDGGRDSVGR
jgi:hypothetical protein